MPVGIGDPVIEGAPIVLRYPPSARSGMGYPVGIDDELFALVGRPEINSTGLAWWYTTAGIGSSTSKDISVRLWNPVAQAWVAYSGIMWQPSYNTGKAGYRITEFMVKITNLTPI